MTISEPFVRRPVMTVVLTGSVILFGVLAYFALPVNDLPAVDYPVIQVSVNYPGATPDTMANNVATPLERQFMQIPGLESTSFLDWLTWPSRFWSVGPALAETLFDAGLRRATVEQYQASFNQAVASYRGTVLTAFQQVEDNLAALRILAREIQQQDAAVESAARNLRIATARNRAGIDLYLNVITAQTTLLSNQQTAVTLRRQQMTASVQLAEALGGSWNVSDLPSATHVAGRGR
jgi:hypothetical protein